MPAVPIYIVSALLLLGAAPLPYGYYTLLRITAFVFFIWASSIAYDKRDLYLPWVFALLAILFNPIIPVHLAKEYWVFIDIGAAIFVIFSKSKLMREKHESA